jgi:hypothetical protein
MNHSAVIEVLPVVKELRILIVESLTTESEPCGPKTEKVPGFCKLGVIYGRH